MRPLDLGKANASGVNRTQGRDEAFWARVDRSGKCWIWTGATSAGYGVFKFRGTRILAHRYSIQRLTGQSAAGTMVDHLCRNKACVNPQHLRLATNGENQQNLRGARSSSKSGVLGVHWEPRKNRWEAEVQADGRRVRKHFLTLDEAEAWAIETRQELHGVPRP